LPEAQIISKPLVLLAITFCPLLALYLALTTGAHPSIGRSRAIVLGRLSDEYTSLYIPFLYPDI
jgi:hypothetical protein